MKTINAAVFERFYLIIPQEAVNDYPRSGDCGPLVAHWAPRLARPATVTPAALAAELKAYGAWDADELADDAENWNRIVWLAIGDLRDKQRENGNVEISA